MSIKPIKRIPYTVAFFVKIRKKSRQRTLPFLAALDYKKDFGSV